MMKNNAILIYVDLYVHCQTVIILLARKISVVIFQIILLYVRVKFFLVETISFVVYSRCICVTPRPSAIGR